METTLQEQLDWLNEAREADADPGFLGRMLALCSLPRIDQGLLSHFVRANRPITLAMIAVEIPGSPMGTRFASCWPGPAPRPCAQVGASSFLATNSATLWLAWEFALPMVTVGRGYETRWSDSLAPPYRSTTGETANPFAWPEPNHSTELWRLILRTTPPQIPDERGSGVYT